MKECEEGGNEVLSSFVKILKYQEYCEWILKKDMKEAYLVLHNHDGLYAYYEGLIEESSSVLLELRRNGVIEVNVDSYELLKVNGEDVKGIKKNEVLDLSDDGERWEGDVLQNKPYGWGVLYDGENRMVYEGFRIGEVSVCYGTRYYSDVGVIEYEGKWFEGKRWGRGAHYDRTGKTVFDGEWMDDLHLEKRVVLNEENQFLHSHIENLIVEDNSCNGREWRVLDLSFMPNLRLLQVGDDCFKFVKEMKLIGLNQLERVVIGWNCFTKEKSNLPCQVKSNSHFDLKDCERLRELKIGCYSFNYYAVCEIENVPSLEVIEMGNLNKDSYCFFYASLELKSDT